MVMLIKRIFAYAIFFLPTKFTEFSKPTWFRWIQSSRFSFGDSATSISIFSVFCLCSAYSFSTIVTILQAVFLPVVVVVVVVVAM